MGAGCVLASERAWVVVRMYDYGHDGSEELLWLYDSWLGLRIGSRDFGQECTIGPGDDIDVLLCITGFLYSELLRKSSRESGHVHVGMVALGWSVWSPRPSTGINGIALDTYSVACEPNSSGAEKRRA